MTKFKTLTSATALMFAMAAAPTMAQVAPWDTNGDGVMSATEFSAAFTDRGVFEVWDIDEDGLISGEELSVGVYETIDSDESGEVTAPEYVADTQRAPDYWFDQTVSWDAWDIDGDGVILANEFAEGWSDIGLLSTWDTNNDGLLSETEFATGVFYKYDENNDGIIEEPELTDIGDDMGDGGFWDI
ncbi:hypothetical protein MXMO3_02747 [Maritalea myrionectae]|uniref:EF-hand domain-containing protein n=1 Tax=Maritalea myrionectae TaxID=454601 RepID=A0A2R4MGU3_9HYPH|nr:hypothetical protein [Maritalea myrionectae]AVX05258.1 hypothetical protein MXMO3_02747 [Maritalea myrionectae]